MTGTSIAAYARILTNTNSTTLTDADILTMLNVKYGHRILDILKVQVDKNASMEESYTDLVSSTGLVDGDNGFNGEYSFPSDLLRPVRVEVKFDDTFIKAEVYDLPDNGKSEWQESEINDRFNKLRPYVRFERDSFFIRPLTTTSVTGGIHIWYEKRQESLTSLTETPDFEQNLHDILAFDIAELEALRHPERYTTEWRNAFQVMKAEVERRFLDFEKNRFKRNFQMKPKFISYK